MKTISIILLLSIGHFTLLAQSGWVREKKGFFIQGSANHFSSDDYYNIDGNLQTSTSGTRFTTSTFKIYGEYGITDKITLLGNVPLVQVNSLSTTDNVIGIGNIRVGAKYQLYKAVPISLAFEAEIPTGNGEQFAEANNVNELGFRDRINLPTTDGELNFWTTLAMSKSNSTGNLYASIYSGLNIRTEGLSHQSKTGVEVGTFLFEKLWLIGKMSVQKTLADNPEIVPFLYGEGTEFTNYGITALYKFTEHFSITAEYADYSGFLIGQKNIYAGPTLGLGIAWEF